MAEYTQSLEFFDRQHDQQNLILAFIVTLISICGLIGNFHVVLVYTCRLTTKTTFKGCIVWLAALDLLNCVIVMPMDITYFIHPYSVYNSSGCKLKHYLGQFVTFSAVAVTLVIAIDRYRKVCKPTYRQIRYREGRLLCGGLVLIFALTLIPVPVMMGLENVENVAYNVTLQKCGIDQSFKDSVVPKVVIYLFVCVLYVASLAVVGIYFQLGKYLRQRNKKLCIPTAIRRRISRKETFSKADLLKMQADPSYHPSPSPTPSTSSDESNFISETQPRSVFYNKNGDSPEYRFDDMQTRLNDIKYSESDIDSGLVTCSQISRDQRGIVNTRKRKAAITSIASIPDDAWPDAYENDDLMSSKTNVETKENNQYMQSNEANRDIENIPDISGAHQETHDDNSHICRAIDKYSEETTELTRNQITRKAKVELTDSIDSCKSSKRLVDTLDTNVDTSNCLTTSTDQNRKLSDVSGGRLPTKSRICNSVFYNRISTNINHNVFLSEKRERRQQRNNTVVKMCYIIAVVCLMCLLPATVTFLLTFAKMDKRSTLHHK
ncbi:uncharacterized protein LOC110464422 [Mizuhopecten yessoensis]|uniref:uncharacterized protein LOC110464422 n=1 Tax=Mizuhopecten yessoensis TaxID=6573 RepID=UPI000B45B304|nr:uncharacterized protein LOC110464422 [Mizuhopecten yessoensis]